MIDFFKKNIHLIILTLTILIFFNPFFLKGKLPIPSDDIIGLYHPYRDLYAATNPNGIPYQNFLITDPVRQTYPWKKLVIEKLLQLQLPFWNPYEMAGKPLLANFQSGVFYPLNVLLFIPPFYFSWSLFILIQQILAGLFLFVYLCHLSIDRKAALLGSIAWCFSGFVISWLEWGTIVHTILWLPLLLLSIDNLTTTVGLKNKQKLQWSCLFLFALFSSFTAGHLQVFVYAFIFLITYSISRILLVKNKFKVTISNVFLFLIFLLLSSIQWIPTLQFIFTSARTTDQIDGWKIAGWFIPWQHLIQFLIPDFFGNPVTGNYWGVWNYAELVGFVGIIPLLFAIFALFNRFDRKTLFFGTGFFFSLLFSLPTSISKLPFIFNLPFIATAQPTRLLSIVCLTLSILAAFGFDFFLKNFSKSKNIIYIYCFAGVIFVACWTFAFNYSLFQLAFKDILVTKNNLIFPSIIYCVSFILVFLYVFLKKKSLHTYIMFLFIGLTIFDVLRFSIKFEPFTSKEYLFPKTKTLAFLENQKEIFRIASSNNEIFPPNFSTQYKLQSIEGYDPLYINSYGQFIAAMERGKPNILPPFGFNRIITPRNSNSKFFDLLNVKYVMSFNDLPSSKFEKVFEEGKTKVFENKNVLPRAFFVRDVVFESHDDLVIQSMHRNDFDVATQAIITGSKEFDQQIFDNNGKVEISAYSENEVIIKTENDEAGFLVISDVYYPTWKAKLDNATLLKIYKTDFAFRGMYIPKGAHTIRMSVN